MPPDWSWAPEQKMNEGFIKTLNISDMSTGLNVSSLSNIYSLNCGEQ